MCDRQELLVGFIYDELSAAERREMEAHVAVCSECRVEVEGFRSTRAHLAMWAPPEPDLGFRVIRGGSTPASALPRRARLVPALAFAAAAVLVLAAAAAIANVEVRYRDVVVRAGWSQPVSTPAAEPVRAAADPVPVPASVDVAALDRRLRDIEAAVAAQPADRVMTAASGQRSDVEMLRRVRELVAEAESRQRVALAQALMQVINDFDRQRRTDMASLQQGIGHYQGLTNAEIAQTRDMVNQLMRVAKQER